MTGLTVLGSGSRGNALVVHGSEGALLVDAGFSCREVRRRLKEAGIDESVLRAIVVSHEHDDHVRGLRVLADRLSIPVYANRLTAEAVRDRRKAPEKMMIFASGTPFEAAGFEVEPFNIPHDALDPVGFVIRSDGCRIGVATDLGHASHLACHRLQGCHALVVESNHDVGMLRDSSRPWSLKQRILGRHGHLSNEASMDLVKRVLHADTRVLVLAHASEECNSYSVVEGCAADCLQSVGRADIRAAVARQSDVLETFWL